MDASRKAPSAERPPSPKAPTGARFRHRRARVATGAAVISLALATALGPAAADELLTDDASRTEAATWVRVDDPSGAARLNMAKSAKGPSQQDKETLVLELIRQQREAEATFARVAAEAEAEAEATFARVAAEAEAEAEATFARVAAEEAERQREDEHEHEAEREAAPEPEPEAPSAGPSAPSGGPWDSLAACESGGNWSINTGNGYYGGLQFSASTWRAFGGSGMPHENSRGAQIAVAQRVQASQGWGAWPSCSSQLGLR
ncbi:MAG: transglycosylase family protein [Iamia sp.]